MGSPAHTSCLPDACELQKMQIQFLRAGGGRADGGVGGGGEKEG